MRIVFESDGYLPDVIGGLEVLADLLIAELRARGHEVLVITSCIGDQPAGRYSHGGTQVMKFNFGDTLMTNDLPAVARLQRAMNAVVADFKPDLLHINDSRASAFFMVRRGALAALPRLLTLHAPMRPTNRGALLGRLADDCDVAVGVSRFVAGSAAADMPAVRDKLRVIANALPRPGIMPLPLPVPPVLVCIGRVIQDKGMHTAIEALALLRGRGIGARLVIIGDGIYLEALQALVAAHGLESQVEFHGWMMPQDIHDAINTASIVLVPSIWEEAFGLVALQAAQMGRPVIASHTGGLPEIVREGETGLLVPPDDPPALADALARLITDPARMAAMGHQALLHAQRDFDFGRFVDAYENAYQAACTARRVVSG